MRKIVVIILSVFAALILALFSINIWGYLDPLSITNRAFTVIIFPLFTLFTETSFIQLANISFLEDIVYSGYDFFKEIIMPEEQSHLQQIFWIGLFFLLILAGEKLSKRITRGCNIKASESSLRFLTSI